MRFTRGRGYYIALKLPWKLREAKCEVQDVCGSQWDIDMSNQLCYTFRLVRAINRHQSDTYTSLEKTTYREDYLWVKINKAVSCFSKVMNISKHPMVNNNSIKHCQWVSLITTSPKASIQCFLHTWYCVLLINFVWHFLTLLMPMEWT